MAKVTHRIGRISYEDELKKENERKERLNSKYEDLFNTLVENRDQDVYLTEDSEFLYGRNNYYGLKIGNHEITAKEYHELNDEQKQNLDEYVYLHLMSGKALKYEDAPTRTLEINQARADDVILMKLFVDKETPYEEIFNEQTKNMSIDEKYFVLNNTYRYAHDNSYENILTEDFRDKLFKVLEEKDKFYELNLRDSVFVTKGYSFCIPYIEKKYEYMTNEWKERKDYDEKEWHRKVADYLPLNDCFVAYINEKYDQHFAGGNFEYRQCIDWINRNITEDELVEKILKDQDVSHIDMVIKSFNEYNVLDDDRLQEISERTKNVNLKLNLLDRLNDDEDRMFKEAAQRLNHLR